MGQSNIHDCWNCGGPGINHVGSIDICPTCDVTWRPFAYGIQPRHLNDTIVYNGIVLDVVDFTKPGAPSCPS